MREAHLRDVADPERVDLAVERRAGDAEHGRGLVTVAAGLVERLDDRVGLGGLEHREPRGLAGEAQGGEVRGLDDADGFAGDDVAQYVLELADVAGPGVPLE